MSLNQLRRIKIKKLIAGSISLSENPGKVLRQWRKIFGASQRDLAVEMKVSPTIISDYESGRRTHPRSNRITQLVVSLLNFDDKYGGGVTNELVKTLQTEETFHSLQNPMDVEVLLDELSVQCIGNGGGVVRDIIITESPKTLIDISSGFFKHRGDLGIIFLGDFNEFPFEIFDEATIQPSFLLVWGDSMKNLSKPQKTTLGIVDNKDKLLETLSELK